MENRLQPFQPVGKKGIINAIFNRLLSILDEHKLLDWSAISLDGSNIRAMRCAAGAKKNIPISPMIMAWVAHEAVTNALGWFDVCSCAPDDPMKSFSNALVCDFL